MADLLWFLLRLSTRLLLVFAVCMTALCQFRCIAIGLAGQRAQSMPEGWCVEFRAVTSGIDPDLRWKRYSPKFLSRGRAAFFDDPDLKTWYGCRNPEFVWVFIHHWVIWSPLLALNVPLWWIDRRRKRMAVDDGS